MSRATLILTRPHTQTAFWAQALAELGVATAILPLLDIAAKHDLATTQAKQQILAQLGQYQAIMHVSPNAALYYWDQAAQQAWQTIQTTLPKTPSTPRLWSPGPGTSRTLLSLGFSQDAIDQPDPQHSTQFDSEALWRSVHAQVTPPFRVLILRGSSTHSAAANAAPEGLLGSGRSWLAQTLQQQGATVEFLSVYERRAPVWKTEHYSLVDSAAQGASVWLFNSSEAADQLTEHFPDRDWHTHQAIATHPRIADTLQRKGFGAVSICLPTPAAIAQAFAAKQPQ